MYLDFLCAEIFFFEGGDWCVDRFQLPMCIGSVFPCFLRSKYPSYCDRVFFLKTQISEDVRRHTVMKVNSISTVCGVLQETNKEFYSIIFNTRPMFWFKWKKILCVLCSSWLKRQKKHSVSNNKVIYKKV